MSLNNKQIAFCREYVVDYNATKAAIRAGYRARSATAMASRLLTLDNIKAEIAENEAIIATKSRVTPEWIANKLEDVVKKGLGIEDVDVVIKESMGSGVTATDSRKVKKADLQAAKGALDILARIKGMYKDELEIKGEVIQRVINLNPTKKDD